MSTPLNLEVRIEGETFEIDGRLVVEKAARGAQFLYFERIKDIFGIELLEDRPFLVTENPRSVQLQFKAEVVDGDEVKQTRKLCQIFVDPANQKYYFEWAGKDGKMSVIEIDAF